MLKKEMQGKKMLVESIIFYRNIHKYMDSRRPEGAQLSTLGLFFLFYLEDKVGVTYYKLSTLLPYEPSFISRSIKDLEKKDLIHRIKVGNKKIIELTETGRNIIQTSSEKRNDFITLLEKHGLEKDELVSFFKTMVKFSKILEAEMGDL